MYYSAKLILSLSLDCGLAKIIQKRPRSFSYIPMANNSFCMHFHSSKSHIHLKNGFWLHSVYGDQTFGQSSPKPAYALINPLQEKLWLDRKWQKMSQHSVGWSCHGEQGSQDHFLEHQNKDHNRNNDTMGLLPLSLSSEIKVILNIL